MPEALRSRPAAPTASFRPHAARSRALVDVRSPAHGRRLLVQSLLDGTSRIADVPEAAAALGLPADGRYVVVAVSGGAVTERATRRDSVVPPDLVCRWHVGTRVDYGIVLLDGDAHHDAHHDAHDDTALDRIAPRGTSHDPAPSAHDHVRTGVGLAVDGLGALDVARRHADVALAASPGSPTARLDDHLPAAMAAASPDLARALAARALGPLLRLRVAERDVLLATLDTWLECDGSAPRAARRLACHRNTVRNRLRRCEQLTGRSLARPADILEIGLALRALRLLRPELDDRHPGATRTLAATRPG